MSDRNQHAHEPFDVLVDFSSDTGTGDALEIALAVRKPLFVGTTGLSESTRGRLRDASAVVPVMVAANTSLAVAVLSALVTQATALLGEDYLAAISETHHTKKADRPSGTALFLADAVAQGGGQRITRDQIESNRVGDVVGDHEVKFTGPFDSITLRHQASSRDLFAAGALKLAKWLCEQPPGFYSLSDWFRQHQGGSR